MVILFFIVPVMCLALCFFKDDNITRKWILNAMLIANAIFYMMPLAYAWYYSLPDGNMWSENESGAVLWYYFYIFPICLILLVILFILKMIFRKRSVSV